MSHFILGDSGIMFLLGVVALTLYCQLGLVSPSSVLVRDGARTGNPRPGHPLHTRLQGDTLD